MERISAAWIRSALCAPFIALFFFFSATAAFPSESFLRPYPADPALKKFEAFDETHAANAPLFACDADGAQVYYQSLFTPRSAARWEGDVRKFAFDAIEGRFRCVWSASESLNSGKVRRILTPRVRDEEAGLDLTLLPLTVPNMVELTADGAEILSRRIGFPDTTAGELFLRWFLEPPLFDMVRGGVALVGPPRREARSDEAHALFAEKETNVSRRRVLYAQSNGGALHALDETTGDELWAFVPPNVLEGRLRGLKLHNVRQGNRYLHDVYEEIPPESTATASRFILDGPIVAEDAFVDGGYITLLLAFLGRGGEGLFALDVTAPEQPRFLWALENAHYRGEGGTTIFWRGDGESVVRTTEIGAGGSWRALGLTTGTPFIGFHSSAGWLFVTGNGSSGGYTGRDEGAVYVGRARDGSMVREMKAPANSGAFVGPVAMLRGEGGARRRITTFFVAGSGGRIYEGDLSSLDPLKWRLREAARLQGNVGPSYAMEAARLRGERWLFAGTGDSEGTGGVSTFAFLEAINLDNASKSWRFRLDGNVEAGRIQLFASPPVLSNGVLFFTTVVRGNDGVVEESRVYALRGVDGSPALSSGRGYVAFRNVLLSGLSISGGRLSVSLSGGVVPGEVFLVEGLIFSNAGGNLLSIGLSELLPALEEGARRGGLSLYWRFP
ncbi:MAG: PilC/PilY family type IV pilus protein [Synergistaceae bacterium]|nr:PilC/PilY family type IV pilus protein [Synergistaceae bacterium]